MDSNLSSLNVATKLKCLLHSKCGMQICYTQVRCADMHIGTETSPTGATGTMQVSKTTRTTLATYLKVITIEQRKIFLSLTSDVQLLRFLSKHDITRVATMTWMALARIIRIYSKLILFQESTFHLLPVVFSRESACMVLSSYREDGDCGLLLGHN